MRSRELSNKAFCLINSLSTQNKSRWALSDAGYKDHYKESNTAPNTVRLFKMPQNKLNVNICLVTEVSSTLNSLCQ